MVKTKTQYLRAISNAVLAYQENWREFDEGKTELPVKDEVRREVAWNKIVDLAEEISDLTRRKR